MTWCQENGPFDTVVDGANVGMYKQSFEDGQFDFQQVERLMSHLREVRGPEAGPVLLVLHQRRVRLGPAKTATASHIIRQWEMSGALPRVQVPLSLWHSHLIFRIAEELYTTPDGSNDDWYWLYAAVNAGPGCILVTNDELRDHVFQMLPSPQKFYKWKERHQARAIPGSPLECRGDTF